MSSSGIGIHFLKFNFSQCDRVRRPPKWPFLYEYCASRCLEIDKHKLRQNCSNFIIFYLLMRIMNEFDILSILEVKDFSLIPVIHTIELAQ